MNYFTDPLHHMPHHLLGAYGVCRTIFTSWGRVANPRPVATIKKLATGRVTQRQVLTRTVDHGEVSRRIWTGFNSNGARVYETGLGDTIEHL